MAKEIRLYQLCRYTHCKISPGHREKMERLMAEHPEIVRAVETIKKKENNAHCDVLHLLTHTSRGGDIFVTNDGNFHKQSKHEVLERLTGSLIVKTHEAVREVTLFSNGQPRRQIEKERFLANGRVIWIDPKPTHVSKRHKRVS